MVVIRLKQVQEDDLKPNPCEALANKERIYSNKRMPDPRQQELLDTVKDKATSNTLDFTIHVLRSIMKRVHDNISTDLGKTILSDDEVNTKHVKAILALLDQFSDKRELSLEKEAAIIVSAVKYNILILQSYVEVVNYLDYGKQQKATIDFEVGQLLVNNTQKEKPCPKRVNLISSK